MIRNIIKNKTHKKRSLTSFKLEQRGITGRKQWNDLTDYSVTGEGPFSVIALLSTTIGKHPFLGIIKADLEGKYKSMAGLNYIKTVSAD